MSEEELQAIREWCNEPQFEPLWDADEEAPGPPAVRPIAAGEVLRRLIGKVACDLEETKDTAETLPPLQFGVNVAMAPEQLPMYRRPSSNANVIPLRGW